MSLKGIVIAAMVAMSFGAVSHADSDIVIKYDGEALAFSEKPIIRSDKTLVQLRPIAEAMALDIAYIEETGEVVLSSGETTVVFVNGSDIIKINDTEKTMIAPATNHHDYFFVPVRDLAEPFGKVVGYDEETKMVTISTPPVEEPLETEEETYEEEQEPIEEEEPFTLYQLVDVPSGRGKFESYYYYQSQKELPFENNGRGFCWVCSYAMLLSNVTGNKITPIEVANVNLENGFGANVTYHTKIMEKFGCEFVPALPEDSPYFDGFDILGKGETTIKFEDEAGLIAAYKEMLDMSPQGILVRYECYPHTMMAVGYDEENIYFNDPGVADAEHIPFSETCLKSYSLSDISYVQAIRMVEGE